MKVIQFLQEQYGDTLQVLGMEMEYAEGNEIRVIQNNPTIFRAFAENIGYANRHFFDTYDPYDVLSFVVMAHHQLFEVSCQKEIDEVLANSSS